MRNVLLRSGKNSTTLCCVEPFTPYWGGRLFLFFRKGIGMANEVTIDSIQIEIEAESASAASNLDALAQSMGGLILQMSRI